MAAEQSQVDRYALIGHPIAHSRSPTIHALFARQTGQQLTYETIDAPAEDFETGVLGFRAAGGKGMNVTVPHKEAAFHIAEELGEDAARAGAVNTLTFVDSGPIRGDNTDGIGFLRDLTVNEGEDPQSRRVLILGAGGAARGILGPLLEAAPAELVIANRTLERAERLAEDFGGARSPLSTCAFANLASAEPFDIVINATSFGLGGGDAPFPREIVGATTYSYDLSYSQADTPFVTWAVKHGARRAVQGWGMLVEQAAESFWIWRQVRPDTRSLLAQLPR